MASHAASDFSALAGNNGCLVTYLQQQTWNVLTFANSTDVFNTSLFLVVPVPVFVALRHLCTHAQGPIACDVVLRVPFCCMCPSVAVPFCCM